MTLLKRRAVVFCVLLTLAVNLTGCGDKEFSKHIDDFQNGVNNTTTAIGIYYAELNEFERELYLQERLFDPSLEVVRTDANGKPTALVGETFSAESIKARTDAIQMLGTYGKRLASLAGSDAPTRFAAGSKSLGENFAALGVTFSTLTSDSTAQKYTAPLGALGAIVGVIGQMSIESKRDAALTKAVTEAAPEVDKIISLLEEDLKTVVGPTRLLGTKQQLAIVVNNYNVNRTSMSLDARKKALDEINRAQSTYDLAVAFNPSDLLGSMRDAHEALIKYAKSGRKISNLQELSSTLEVFHERAEVIAKAVVQLRALREGS
jgi:hypothetical protein